MHIPAPKQPLPGHDESYNPPPEYLPTPSEVGEVSIAYDCCNVCVCVQVKEWEEEEPEERKRNFLPHK